MFQCCYLKKTGMEQSVCFKSHMFVKYTCIYSCSICVYLLGGGLSLSIKECVCWGDTETGEGMSMT